MKSPFWVYLQGTLNSPVYASTPTKLLHILNGAHCFEGVLDIVNGNATYHISCKVASDIAARLLKGETVPVSALGESFPIESAADFVGMLQVFKTERLYLEGGAVLSSAASPDTILRKVYADSYKSVANPA